MTEWREITGFEDYEVSDDGRIRLVVPRRRHPAGYQLKARVDWKGYAVCGLRRRVDGVVKLRKVHRVVAETFIGLAPTLKHEVAHGDGDKTNNHYSNLRWCLHRENERDKIKHKTLRQGEAVAHLAKLTEPQVIQIRKEFARGESIRALANATGVTFQNIWYVVHRKTWAHVA